MRAYVRKHKDGHSGNDEAKKKTRHLMTKKNDVYYIILIRMELKIKISSDRYKLLKARRWRIVDVGVEEEEEEEEVGVVRRRGRGSRVKLWKKLHRSRVMKNMSYDDFGYYNCIISFAFFTPPFSVHHAIVVNVRINRVYRGGDFLS